MNPAPITREEAYKALRLLALRMDATAEAEHAGQSASLEEAKERFLWACAIDHVLNAVDAVRS